MWLSERKTASRGRAGVPETRLRIPMRRRWRRAALALLLSMAWIPVVRSGAELLALLLLDDLGRVLDPLAVVGLGLLLGAHFGRELADDLLVGPLHLDELLVHRDLEARGDVHHDGVGVADDELELLALD